MDSSACGPIDKTHFCQSPEECLDYYDNWADNYDEDVKELQYRGPQLLAEVCLQFLDATKKDAKILDFLCGTGELGRLLQQNGYENIDGIDGSIKMIEKAKIKECYKNLYVEALSRDKESEFLPSNDYDMVAGIGVLSPGHMDAEFLHHLYQPVKKNGLIIFGIRQPWIEKLNLDTKVAEIEKAGLWKLMRKISKENYRENLPAIFYILEKL